MFDHSLVKLCAHSPQLEHLELCRCDGISDYGINQVMKTANKLRVLDLN